MELSLPSRRVETSHSAPTIKESYVSTTTLRTKGRTIFVSTRADSYDNKDFEVDIHVKSESAHDIYVECNARDDSRQQG